MTHGAYMPDSPKKTNIRDKGLLDTLRDFNELRAQSADIGNAFFEKSTEHNGPSDAMRHIIFNAKLTAGTGSRLIPWLLDKIHEYGESAIPIPGLRQPNREMRMDLANGELGRAIGKLNLSDAEMVDLAQRAVQSGKAATLIDDDSTKAYAEGGSVIVDEDGNPVATPLEEEVQNQFGMEPGLDRASLIPYKSKEHGWVAPEILYDIAKLVTSPIAALHGKYISPEETISSALTIGGIGTPIGLARPVESGVARMFIGPKSKSWDAKSHALALKMADEGASPSTIWQKTGNWQMPDKNWAQEIIDPIDLYNEEKGIKYAKDTVKAQNADRVQEQRDYEDAGKIGTLFKDIKNSHWNSYLMRHPDTGEIMYNGSTGQPLIEPGFEQEAAEFQNLLRQKAVDKFAEKYGYPASEKAIHYYNTVPHSSNIWFGENLRKPKRVSTVNWASPTGPVRIPMKEVIDHPELLEAYPELGNIRFTKAAMSPGTWGVYSPNSDRIGLSKYALNPSSTLTHELQHAVQQLEGWEGGANPKDFPGYSNSAKMALYYRNLGETVARATQARRGLLTTEAERRAVFPETSFNLPGTKDLSTEEIKSQLMWQGMDPLEKTKALKTTLRGPSSESVMYDPDKVDSIVSALHDDAKFAKGGEVKKSKDKIELPPIPTLNDHAPYPKTDNTETLDDIINNLSYGLGEGFGHQMQGLGELVTHPIESAKNIYHGVKAMVEDPSLIKQAAADIATRATGSTQGLGEVIGENVSPTGIVKRLAGVGNPAIRGIVKTKGGNWISDIRRGVTGGPETYALALTNEKHAPELNDWLNTKLTRYIRNEMGTAEDPVLHLFDQGIKHFDLEDPERAVASVQELNRAAEYAANRRKIKGFPAEGVAKTPTGKAWEDAVERDIYSKSASSLLPPLPEDPSVLSVREAAPWLEKLPPETPIYHFNTRYWNDDLGFKHLTDELHNATREGDHLPEHLKLDPSKLSKVTVPQAVQLVDKINTWRKENAGKANLVLANNPATVLHKDYPEEGFRWVQLKKPTLEQITLPEGTERLESTGPGTGTLRVPGISNVHVFHGPDPQNERAWSIAERRAKDALATKHLENALGYEGDIMNHCVGGYCPEVEAEDRQIFSLRDSKGNPHATIEVVQDYPAARDWEDIDPQLKETYLDTIDQYFKDHPDHKTSDLSPREINDILKEYKAPRPQPYIRQIRGKGNAAPIDKYTPYVQDFVKSGNWADVQELSNARLSTLDDHDYDDAGMAIMQLRERMKEAGTTPDQKYFTEQELRDLMTKHGVDQNFAQGGLVASTDQTGYNRDRVQSIVDQLHQEMLNG